MEEGLHWSVMMGIVKMEMDVHLHVRYRKDISALEEAQYPLIPARK